MKNLIGIILLCFVLFFCTKLTNAQIYTIDQGGSFNSCSGNFFDSGSNTSNYQNNENYTITFCSNGGGNAVSIDFSALFDVDPSDTLFIFDGNSTAAPLIGSYNNNNVPSGVSSTTANTTACITLQFISNGSLSGLGWDAVLSCIMACQPIDPVISTVPALINLGPDSTYTNICAGDNVLFNVSGTYPDNGANPYSYAQSDGTSTFDWSLGTGNTAVTQATNQVYTIPQGYLVTLTVTDANNCSETVKHRVRMGVPPNFAGVFAQPDTACYGDTINLLGGFTQTTTAPAGVTPVPGMIFAGGITTGQTFLPDGSGASYSTPININGFNGQTIMNGTDIEEVCMNIEHSYLGDLVIELECPNGTKIDLSNTFGFSPGSTFLGDADDAPSPSITPGIGMNYCFDLSAAFGTMSSENALGNWIPSTVTPGNNILTPGSYQPDQSFNDLIGCPIDGNWNLIITDYKNLDNGYIFEWSLTINPAINPNSENYNVDILSGVWLPDPDIINDFDTLAIALPTTAGAKPFVFQVTDEYGCIFDTTIQVVVLPELTPVATPDTVLCLNMSTPLNINAGAPLGTSLNYLWSPSTGLSDPTISSPIFNGSSTTMYTVDVTHTNFPQCAITSNPITIEVRTDPDPVLLGDSSVCIGDMLTLSISNSDSILWPDGSTTSSVTFTPSVDTLITVTAVNFCNTFTFNQNISVNDNPSVTASSDTSIIIQDSAQIAAFTADTGVTYLWSPMDDLGCFTCSETAAAPIETTVYTVEITDTNGCTAEAFVEVSVFIPDLFIPTGFSPNGDGVNDVVYVRSLDIKTMSFQVFDRWGKLVFETTDQENGWDGTNQGNKLDFGVYFYKFEARFLSGNKMAKSGSITLFR